MYESVDLKYLQSHDYLFNILYTFSLQNYLGLTLSKQYDIFKVNKPISVYMGIVL